MYTYISTWYYSKPALRTCMTSRKIIMNNLLLKCDRVWNTIVFGGKLFSFEYVIMGYYITGCVHIN